MPFPTIPSPHAHGYQVSTYKPPPQKSHNEQEKEDQMIQDAQRISASQYSQARKNDRQAAAEAMVKMSKSGGKRRKLSKKSRKRKKSKTTNKRKISRTKQRRTKQRRTKYRC